MEAQLELLKDEALAKIEAASDVKALMKSVLPI